MPQPTQPPVVVIVGTDHHPFDRLVEWVDRWARSRDRAAVIQYGTSSPPGFASGRDLIPQDELRDLLDSAAAVVCHGGPGTIMAARDAGHLPIVVPRRPELGEHVDDHQILFSGRLAADGQVVVPTTEPELHGLLDDALVASGRFRLDGSPDAAARAAERFADLVDPLIGSGPGVRILPIVGRRAPDLGRALGGVPGVAWIGDLDRLWSDGVERGRACRCGVPFADCPFWSEVGKRAFGGWDQLDERRMLRLLGRVDRSGGRLRLRAARLAPSLDAEVGAGATQLMRLAEAILGVAGARLVAGSASIGSAALWRQAPAAEVRVVRVVGFGLPAGRFGWGRRTMAVRELDLRQDPGGLVPGVMRFAGTTGDGEAPDGLGTAHGIGA